MPLARFACAGALVALAPFASAQCGFDPNYGGGLGLGDDAVTGALALGFTVSFGGANYDSAIVSSNGFFYLWNSTGSVPIPTAHHCCNGDQTLLRTSTSPIIAGMWMDLNPGVGGSVHFNALPGKAIVTWNAVPEYSNTGANTFQIAIDTAGNVQFAFDANCRNTSHTALTGMSPGSNSANPGGSDLSSGTFPTTSATVYEIFGANAFDLQSRPLQFFTLGPSAWVVTPLVGCASWSQYGAGCPAGSPLTMVAQAGSRPVLGQNFTLEISNVRNGSLGGAVGFGFVNPNLNLGANGLPACTLLSTIDVSLGVAPTSPLTQLGFPIPNFSSIIGASLNAQAVMVDPSLGGTLPVYLSNGVQMVFGN